MPPLQSTSEDRLTQDVQSTTRSSSISASAAPELRSRDEVAGGDGTIRRDYGTTQHLTLQKYADDPQAHSVATLLDQAIDRAAPIVPMRHPRHPPACLYYHLRLPESVKLLL